MSNAATIKLLEEQNAAIDTAIRKLGQCIIEVEALKKANNALISQLIGTPRIEAGPMQYDARAELLNAGFISAEELQRRDIKALCTWIDANICGNMGLPNFTRTVQKVTQAVKAGKVAEKVPYLINSLKRALEEADRPSD